jgi:hypothetical protein
MNTGLWENGQKSLNKLHGCKLTARSRTSEQWFVFVYSVISVSSNTVLIRTYEVKYTINMRRFITDYLYELLVGGG